MCVMLVSVSTLNTMPSCGCRCRCELSGPGSLSLSLSCLFSHSWASRAARPDHGSPHVSPRHPDGQPRPGLQPDVLGCWLLPAPLRLLPVLPVYGHLGHWPVPAVRLHLRRGNCLRCFHKEKFLISSAHFLSSKLILFVSCCR